MSFIRSCAMCECFHWQALETQRCVGQRLPSPNPWLAEATDVRTQDKMASPAGHDGRGCFGLHYVKVTAVPWGRGGGGWGGSLTSDV